MSTAPGDSPADSAGGAALRPRRHHTLLHGDFDLTADEQRRRDLKHRLVQEVRGLVERVALVDAATADERDLEKLPGEVRRISERLDTAPSYRDRGGLNRAPGWEAALTERSPVSGRSNPLAAPLDLRLDGDRTVGHAQYGRAHEGPFDHVHGGIVIGAFDELLGVAQDASGRSGYTGTLTVRLRRPTPLGTRIDYEAGVDRVEGRKVFVWGRSSVGGEVLCEAEGIFVSPRDAPHVAEYGGDRREE